MSCFYRRVYNVFPPCSPTQPEYSRSVIAIAEGVTDAIHEKYSYIYSQGAARPWPHYTLTATLRYPVCPNMNPFDLRTGPISYYNCAVPQESRPVELAELNFLDTGMIWQAHYYHQSGCEEPMPYSFEAVLEYSNPEFLDQLWRLINLTVEAHCNSATNGMADKPVIHGEIMHGLGKITVPRGYGRVSVDDMVTNLQ